MFTLLLEYLSFYTDFKQDASRLEPVAVWYSTLDLHQFAVGWFPFEFNPYRTNVENRVSS